MPLPRSPLADLEAELCEIRATPGARAQAEIDRCLRARGPIEPEVEQLLRSPQAVVRLTAMVEVVWEACVAPWWPRIREVLERDVLRRSRALATGGLAAVFEDLAPMVTLEGAGCESATASPGAAGSAGPACCSSRRHSSGRA
jgi:hypothetical protein